MCNIWVQTLQAVLIHIILFVLDNKLISETIYAVDKLIEKIDLNFRTVIINSVSRESSFLNYNTKNSTQQSSCLLFTVVFFIDPGKSNFYFD